MTNNPRKIALFVLNTLDKKRDTLDNILEDALVQHASLDRRDRGLLYALVYGVLRWRGRLDAMIGKFSKTPLKKINPNILNILRIGLFQMLYLDKIPVSAAVNTSVELAKSSAAPWVVKFVNGILRNIARAIEKSGVSRLASHVSLKKDPSTALSVNKSFPKWLIRRWLNRFGIKETEMLCDAINTIPPITLRTNTLKTSREELVSTLQSDIENIELTPYSPDGIALSNQKHSIFEISAFQQGWFQVQDEAAQLVTYLLNPKPGDTILDACAGLGGKTGHIAQMMKNQGMIIAIDKEKEKLVRLESEMERLGISIVSTCQHDLNEPFRIQKSEFRSQESGVRSQESEVRSQESEVRSLKSGVRSQESGVRSQKSEVRSLKPATSNQQPATSNQQPATSNQQPAFMFDKILLDAPCSGLGVLRRNPDIKWFKTEKDLMRYKKRQIKFLNHLAHLVKPSGLLVYVVCSMEPEENESVVKAFLNQHPEFVLEKYMEGLPDKACSLVNQHGYFRTFPHLNKMDGFFAACFKKIEIST